MIFYQLSRPFGYLSIKGIQGKKSYDWAMPALLSAFTLTFIALTNGASIGAVVSKNGLIESLTGFIANLPGFYIAALAAIATFNRKQIDSLLISNGDSPYILHKRVDSNGEEKETKETITRRLFLCFLFAFLTAESILLVVVTKIFTIVTVPSDYFVVVGYISCFVYFVFFWQLIVSTFFGLYYLGNRIHSSD